MYTTIIYGRNDPVQKENEITTKNYLLMCELLFLFLLHLYIEEFKMNVLINSIKSNMQMWWTIVEIALSIIIVYNYIISPGNISFIKRVGNG